MIYLLIDYYLLFFFQVSSESFYFWLKALGSFEEGEAVLMFNVTSNAKLQELLMSAHNHYQEGLTNLKVTFFKRLREQF